MTSSLRKMALLTLAGVFGLTACSGLGGESDEKLPTLTSIGSAWVADGVGLSIGGYWDQPALWRTDDTLVSVNTPIRTTATTVTGLDAATGATRWTADLTGRVCSISEDVNAAGLGAILLGTAADGSCDEVAVVDTTSGTVVWQASLPAVRRLPILPRVGIGETTVTTAVGCGTVVRFAVADGEALPTLGRSPRRNNQGFDSCTGAGGVADGTSAYSDGKAIVVAGDDGTERFRIAGAGTVQTVVSTDPLVLDVQQDGNRVMRSFDAQGQAGPPIGFRLGFGVSEFTVVAEADGVLVGKYGSEGMLYAYDELTGELLWKRYGADRFSPDRRLFGVLDGDLIWGQAARGPRDSGSLTNGDVFWITRTDIRDPDEGSTLGQVEDSFYIDSTGLWYVAGDLLVSPRSDSIRTYRLDGAGEDGVRAVPAAFVRDIQDDLAWSKKDVRPEAAIGACTAVSASTLTLLQVPTDLPPPASCRWSERPAQGVFRSFDVAVTASKPTSSDSAADVAQKSVTGNAVSDPLGLQSEVSGLGDQAYVRADLGMRLDRVETFVDEPVSGSASLVVRQGNVVVSVTAQTTQPAATAAEGVVPSTLSQAAVAAARDVFAELGRPLADADATRGAAGSVASVPDVCAVDASQGTRLVPKVQPLALVPAGSTTYGGCEWRDGYDAQLVVLAQAVEPGLDGSSAADAAAALIAGAGGVAAPGLGDEAVVVVDPRTRSNRTVAVIARRDNLLVSARFTQDNYRSTIRDPETLVREAVEAVLAP